MKPVVGLALAGLLALLAPPLHAQVGRLPDITMDVGDEPGVVPDEQYEQPPQYARKMVFYRTPEPVGTIIVETAERVLYLVLKENLALRYGIGVGRDGFRWKGQLRVTRKAEWSDWIPPSEMIERQPYLPRFMRAGESARRARALPRRHSLPHSRNQSAADDRRGRFFRLLPAGEQRRH